ncbi:MAG: phosphatase PAP2 family protein [Synergistales bacterium]|nr:phosphatase PAP2 family protein [Synergistales bacterium]
MFPHASEIPQYVLTLLFLFALWKAFRYGYFSSFRKLCSGSFLRQWYFPLLTGGLFLLISFCFDGWGLDLRGMGSGVAGFIRTFGNLYGDGLVEFSILTGGYFLTRSAKKDKLAFWFLGAMTAALVAGLSADLIKVIMSRSRPLPGLAGEGWFLHGLLISSGLGWEYLSFPSGHTSTAASLAFFALFTSSPKISSFLIFFSMITGAARVLSGVHWVSDVAGGFLWAFVCALPVAMFYRDHVKAFLK